MPTRPNRLAGERGGGPSFPFDAFSGKKRIYGDEDVTARISLSKRRGGGGGGGSI